MAASSLGPRPGIVKPGDALKIWRRHQSSGWRSPRLTERERLKGLTLAAGLRLSRAELERLLPLWRRYQALVSELREQVNDEIVRK